MFSKVIRINNVIVESENINLTYTLDESLDFGRFDITRSIKSDPYTMLDEVTMVIDDGVRIFSTEFIIEADNVTPQNASQTKFKHEINLIERTKKLDNYVVGFRAMTQPVIGDKKSLWDRIDELRQTVPFSLTSDLDTTRVFSMGSTLTFLKDIDAPELFFTNKTLREAINEIMSVANGVARLVRDSLSSSIPASYPYNILEIELFNQINTLKVKEDKTNFFQNIQNINEYATKLDINVSNQIFDFTETGGSIFVPSEGVESYKGVRTSTGVYTEDDSFVDTIYKKFKQKKIKMRVPTKSFGIVVIDITENIVEQDIYNTLEENNLSDALAVERGFYQANALIWNFNSNLITNLYTTFPKILATPKPVIERIIKTALGRYFDSVSIADVEFIRQTFDELEFNMQFIPQFDSRSQVERIDGTTSNINKKSTRIINQNDNIISASKSLNSLFVNLQQTGNNQYIANIQSKAIADIYKIGDYTSDGWILGKRELIFSLNSFIAKYEWTKNYQRRSEFIRKNTLPELFDIPAGNRVLKRNEHYNEYIIADFTNTGDEATLINLDFSKAFMNTISQTPFTAWDEPILNVAFKSDEIIIYNTGTGTPIHLNVTDYIMLPVISYAGGNSLYFYWEFNSPNIAGSQVHEVDSKKLLRSVQYTDEVGTLDEFRLTYLSHFNIFDKDFLPLDSSFSFGEILIDSADFKIIKSSGDILAMTFAIHVLPEEDMEDDIVIGERLINRNNLIELGSPFGETFTLISGSGRYDRFENKKGKSGHVQFGDGSYTTFNNRVLVPAISSDSWAIVDSNNNLLLAVNQRQKDTSFTERLSVYFLRKKTRGDIIETY